MKHLLHSIKTILDFNAVDSSIKELWEHYIEASGKKSIQGNILIWRSGPSNQLSRQYVNRILSSETCFASSPYWSYQIFTLPLPRKGDLSILVDWTGFAVAVVESTTVEICSLNGMDKYFEFHKCKYGENIEEVKERILEEAKAFGLRIEESMPVVMETVRLKYTNQPYSIPETVIHESIR